MLKNPNPKEIEEVLKENVETIYPNFELLKKTMMDGKKLRVYCGFDPSSPLLHYGHLTNLKKLAKFQSLGHEVIMLIGDFTGMIGDPTGKISTRKKLTRREVVENSKNYGKIAHKILKFGWNNPAKILYNSKWLDKISFKDLIELASNFTVQQMIIRDMFQERINQKKPIYLQEFLYPLAQAYDSVAMDVDLEIGGSDQIFNMLCGRDLMKILKNKEKFVLATKLIADPSGKKMGKTEGNIIDITKPEELRKGIMRMDDSLIDSVSSGTPFISSVEVNKINEIRVSNPIKAKEMIADKNISGLFGEKKSEETKKEFNLVSVEKQPPSKIQTVEIKEENLNILDLLVKTGLVDSKSEAKRMILQKGIKIDGGVENDWEKNIIIKKGMIIQLGKEKFVKVI
jgi:tyrosyl-tRNA synthetase